MPDRHFLFLPLLLLAALALAPGCHTLFPDPDELLPYAGGSESAPLIGVNYYPYGYDEAYRGGLFRLPDGLTEDRVGRPVPVYHGWTDDRMKNDLAKLRELQIDRLVLMADPRDLSAGKQERYKRFVALLTEDLDNPQAVLQIDCQYGAPEDAAKPLTEAELVAFLDWASQLGLFNARRYYKSGGRPVIEMRNAGPLAGYDSFRFVLAPLDLVRPEPFQRFEALRHARQSRDRDRLEVMVAHWQPAAADSPSQWLSERDNGKNIPSAVRLAVRLRPELLVFESWNNYHNGSFLEQNSLDSGILAEQLRRTLAETWLPDPPPLVDEDPLESPPAND